MNAQEHPVRPVARRTAPTIAALVVIAAGIVLLLANFGFRIRLADAWWAWLILAMAVVPLYRALREYRSAGRVHALVLRELVSAAMIAMIAVVFLLHLAWHTWWPIIVIYLGLCMLLRRRA